MSTQSHDYKHLDAARGFAAFVVLLAHMVQIFWLRIFGLESNLYQVSTIASHYAVVIFFLLSGFLITHSIETNIARNTNFQVLDYLCARFARIYPPFLFAVIVTGIVFLLIGFFNLPGRDSPLSFPGDVYSARGILQLHFKENVSAFMMMGGLLDVNGPLWSLYIEVKLYILLACAYCLKGPVRFVLSTIIGVTVLVAGLRYNAEFGKYASFWIIGCLVFYLANEKIERRRLKIALAILCLFLAVIEGYLRLKNNQIVPKTLGQGIAVELLVAMVLAYLLLYLRMNLFVGSRMAGYSYTLYVTHFPILLFFQSLFVNNADPGIWPTMVFSIAACIVALTLARWAAVLESRKAVIQHFCISNLRLLMEKLLHAKRAA